MKTNVILVILSILSVHFAFGQLTTQKETGFSIAFGSCSMPDKPQPFWVEILKNTPDLFIWGGDIIYGDSDDMSKIENDYILQNKNSEYQKLKKSVPILATWDDHDYGKNDAGAEWRMKKESQQLFLDFLEVSKDDPRRAQEGIYTSKVFSTSKGSVKVIVLDTRFFRSPLQKDSIGKKRYQPYTNKTGTILGDMQWEWFKTELISSKADFNIIVSSIQFLSAEHGWETWGNFSHEIDRFKKILINHDIKNVIILSGDRHISEFSREHVYGLKYPIVDFTSSGLTHSYVNYDGEPNQHRILDVVYVPSFGILKFDFDTREVLMQMRGANNVVLQEFRQQYLTE